MGGIVFDIARFSLTDGPGIRTVVFLKGCPLNCRWCHNPESQSPHAELFSDPQKCVGCRRCMEVCLQQCHDIRNGVHFFDREDCIGCGRCANVCFSGALTLVGRSMTTDEVLKEIRKDHDYYGSCGGLTLSGGEPLFQPEFSRELLEGARRESWHTAVDTSGFADWKSIVPLLPVTGLWLFDLKCVDPVRHQQLTGFSNELILDNLQKLDSSGAKIELRCPLIPGLNDSDEDLNNILKIAYSLQNLVGIHLEPYHPFGLDKLCRLGRSLLAQERIPDEQDTQRYWKKFQEFECRRKLQEKNKTPIFCLESRLQ